MDIEKGYDFGDARFDLNAPFDREVIRFLLSQALYGEATGVFCGKSLYAARSLEAARFYLRQAKQELAHLQLFADIFRELDLTPEPPHWAIRLLAAHNNYYPLKVLMEHAVGEGMVLDIFRDVVLQTLPDDHPGVERIKKKLRVVCMEEEEHVAWGEKETRRLLRESPWLRWPYYGIVLAQLAVVPLVVSVFRARMAGHPVLSHLPAFVSFVDARVRAQGRALGFWPEREPSWVVKGLAVTAGVLLFLRSQLARSRSTLDKTYLTELGFGGPARPLTSPP